MKPEKSDSGVRFSTGGRSGAGISSFFSTTGSGFSFLSRDQRARNASFSSAILHTVLRMLERARLDALLGLRAVVVLHVFAYPGEDLRRHRHAVDRVTAVK